MITIQILSIKNFMNHILNQTTFDSFLLEQASIKTFNTFLIDGHIQKSFYSHEEQTDYNLCPYPFSQWKDLKKICFDLLKGKRLPISFKIVLHLLPETMHKLLSDQQLPYDISLISAFILNIHYENNRLLITTGIGYQSFVMDKQADCVWDNYFLEFLKKYEIEYEKI